MEQDSSGIDWRAQRIINPIGRLRYLLGTTPVALPDRPGWFWGRWWCIATVSSLLLFLPSYTASTASPPATIRHLVEIEPPPQPMAVYSSTPVRLVEAASDHEVYNNGLRIENRFAVSNRSRSYLAYARGSPASELRSEPVGIVFHTTESRLEPFQENQNRLLRRIGQSLLEYVRYKRAYHFVIDRFGRVYRVVAESDAANHAGYSVWTDERWSYINLNDSFLGVSFEAQTQQARDLLSVNPAQIHAGKILCQMLRGKYHIPAANCVTHAQVSVNPHNMRVGYHTDWAGDFPFQEMGLPDNYEQPLPGLYVFGLDYDPAFLKSTEGRLSKGVRLAEERLCQAAARQKMSVAAYRSALRKAYREKIDALNAPPAAAGKPRPGGSAHS